MSNEIKIDLTDELRGIYKAAADFRANAEKPKKKFEVTFAPRDTAPPGELGKPDFFGFIVEAGDIGDAVLEAETRFNAAFGAELMAHYSIIDAEELA